MTQPVVPLTKPGPLWSQREYTACQELHIGFAAHQRGMFLQEFHYHFPGIGCTTCLVSSLAVLERIYHDFEPTPDWIQQCKRNLHYAGR
jgi:hypothetical protein